MKFKKLSDLIKEAETFEGKWELSPEHEVVYRERRRQAGDLRLESGANDGRAGYEREATIKGSLVAAEPDALVISVTTQEELDPNPQRIGTASARAGRSRPIRRVVTGLVKLSGKWELDDKNRITFCIKRGLAKYDKLTFQGAWEINDNFQVTYAFEARPVLEGSGKLGKRRRVTKVSQELLFEGRWDISEKNRLTYLIGIDSESAFRFRGAFEGSAQPQWLGTASAKTRRSRPIRSILAKKGEIRYQAGIEYKTSRGTRKRMKQAIILFGKWKFSDDMALSFEIEYADGRRSEIRLGAELSLSKIQGSGLRRLLPGEVSVGLVSSEGKPLGVELVLTKDLFDGNAKSFVRFQRSLRETAVEAGITIPW